MQLLSKNLIKLIRYDNISIQNLEQDNYKENPLYFHRLFDGIWIQMDTPVNL